MAHRSRLSGFIIDCKTDDLDAATDFWSQALGCSIADRDAGDGEAEYRCSAIRRATCTSKCRR